MNFDRDRIVMLYEDPNIYDGWSAAQLDDGSFVNRWASDGDPKIAMPGYERRFNLTERWLADLAAEAVTASIHSVKGTD